MSQGGRGVGIAREDLDSGGSNYLAVIRCEQAKQSDNSPEQAHKGYLWGRRVIMCAVLPDKLILSS